MNTTVSPISQVLPSLKGGGISPAWQNSTETPHTPPSQPRDLSQPTRNHFAQDFLTAPGKGVAPLQQNHPQSFGTTKPTAWSTEGFANTTQLLRHYWHIPTYGQSWKQGGKVTMILSVPLNTVHRRAGQEGAENTDGSQQLVSTECDNRNRPVLMAATT